MHMRSPNRADAARQHNRFVIAVMNAGGDTFEIAKITANRGAPEFIIKRRRTNRCIQHNLQRRGDARRSQFRAFPCARVIGQAKMRHRITDHARFWFAAATGRAFIADFAARTGCRTGKRRNRGRMIMGFDFGDKMRRFTPVTENTAVGVGKKSIGKLSAQHRRIVAVGDQSAVTTLRMGLANHRKRRLLASLPVDAPIGIENFMAAMFGIDLCEHHQFDIAWIASQSLKLRQ